MAALGIIILVLMGLGFICLMAFIEALLLTIAERQEEEENNKNE